MESQIRRNAWRNHTRTWGLGEISEKKKKKLKNSQGLDQKKEKWIQNLLGLQIRQKLQNLTMPMTYSSFASDQFGGDS